MVADVIAAVASIDPVMGGRGQVMPFSDEVRARLDAGRRADHRPLPAVRGRRCCRCCTWSRPRRATSPTTASSYCAARLGLTEAEVTAVASFYTMYKRHPVGEYHVGVCTNTLCAVMGGDQIFADLQRAPGRRRRRDHRRTARSAWSTWSATRPATTPRS